MELFTKSIVDRVRLYAFSKAKDLGTLGGGGGDNGTMNAQLPSTQKRLNIISIQTT